MVKYLHTSCLHDIYTHHLHGRLERGPNLYSDILFNWCWLPMWSPHIIRGKRNFRCWLPLWSAHIIRGKRNFRCWLPLWSPHIIRVKRNFRCWLQCILLTQARWRETSLIDYNVICSDYQSEEKLQIWLQCDLLTLAEWRETSGIDYNVICSP